MADSEENQYWYRGSERVEDNAHCILLLSKKKKKKLYCSGNVRHFRNYYRGVTGCGTTENEIKN